MSEPFLLETRELVVRFDRRRGHAPVVAVDGVSIGVLRRETFGLVGESGCGKSTLARALLRLIEPASGSVRFADLDIGSLDATRLRGLRRRMQLVFQDPTGSLDPRMRIGELVTEPLAVHGVGTAAERLRRAETLLARVGLPPDIAARRPHELSGGQRQRVGIARALILDPELVVLDEPVSALDVSVQAQVLNLLNALQDELGLTYVFIVHDLAVAQHFCDRLAVLYLGQVMETGTREQLFGAPRHPYTLGLLDAAPVPDPSRRGRRRRPLLRGDAEDATADAVGCPFRSRCPRGHGEAICATERPALRDVGEGHRVACHFV